MKSSRRSVIGKLLSTFAGLAGFNLVAKAQEKKRNDLSIVGDSPDVTLYPGSLRFGNLVFVSGTGADAESVFDIRADTDFVLKKMEKRLLAAGSSMEKVLKVTVFLNDMADFQVMNEVYKGRFGKNPPVRSTVAVAKGGIPGNSIIEIDCIGYV
jgi:2-iminobutanoate/2-iminopropanoate deaminase